MDIPIDTDENRMRVRRDGHRIGDKRTTALSAAYSGVAGNQAHAGVHTGHFGSAIIVHMSGFWPFEALGMCRYGALPMFAQSR